MTLDEAIALVLEEGMRTEPVPDNAMAMLLHRGTEPSDAHIDPLIEALRIIQRELEGQPLLNRELAAALWILGIEASTCLDLTSQEDGAWKTDATADKIIDLMTAVESVFWDGWFVEDRHRDGVTYGDSGA
jgi:hypothetical protein